MSDIVVVRSVANGHTVDVLDDGYGKDGAPSIGRKRLTRMLSKTSPLDGGRVHRIVKEGAPKMGSPIDAKNLNFLWVKDDDKRLEKHLEAKEEVSFEARNSSAVTARRKEVDKAVAEAVAAERALAPTVDVDAIVAAAVAKATAGTEALIAAAVAKATANADTPAEVKAKKS